MTGRRFEAGKPTLWERLFQPLRIPLYATALLLIIGLAVSLYRSNAPLPPERAESTPAKEPFSPEPQRPEASPATTAPSSPPAMQPLQESNVPAQAADRLESVDQGGRSMAAQTEKTNELKSEANIFSGNLFSGLEERQMAEAPMKKVQLSMPDIVLTLISKVPPDKKEALAAKVKEVVVRSGGTLHPVAEKQDSQEPYPHFRLELPKSEYSRFKTELTQVGEVISESQRPSNAPPSEGKTSASSMQIELSFLPEKSQEGSPPAPSNPN